MDNSNIIIGDNHSALGSNTSLVENAVGESRAEPEPWSAYPVGLSYINPIFEDLMKAKADLKHVTRTFCSQQDNRVEVFELGLGAAAALTDEDAVEATENDQQILVHVVPHPKTRNRNVTLSSTPDGLKQLLHMVEASPNVLPLLYQPPTIGIKSGPPSSTTAAPREEMWFCLPLPYSNPHIGEEYDVHSVVVWFEYFATTEKSRFLLLSAPDVVLESLNRFEGSCQESRLHACDIIVFLLQNILKIWNSKMQLVDVFGSITTYTFHQHNNNNGVNISKTMEDLNLKLSGLGKYGANLNYFEVLIGLLKNSKKQHPSNESHRDSYLTQLNGFVAQVRMMRGFLDEIKQRTQHAKSLIVHRISLRNDDTMVANGLEMQRIAKNSEESNTGMAELAKQTREDSRAMKVLAVVTMFYLPWGSVAAIFSMPFFGFDDNNQFKSLQKVWLYFAVAIPVTILTFAIWLLYYFRLRVQTTLRRVFSPAKTSARQDSNLAERWITEQRHRLLQLEDEFRAEQTTWQARIAEYSTLADETTRRETTDEEDKVREEMWEEVREGLIVLAQKGEDLGNLRRALGIE